MAPVCMSNEKDTVATCVACREGIGTNGGGLCTGRAAIASLEKCNLEVALIDPSEQRSAGRAAVLQGDAGHSVAVSMLHAEVLHGHGFFGEREPRPPFVRIRSTCHD